MGVNLKGGEANPAAPFSILGSYVGHAAINARKTPATE
jgi:hypothetical protein